MKTTNRNKTKSFSTPKPNLVRGVPKSKDLILSSMGKVTSKKKRSYKPSSSRPAFIKHVCKREDDCPTCRYYINEVNEFMRRQ